MTLLPTVRELTHGQGNFRFTDPLPVSGGGPGAARLAERLLRGAGVRTTSGNGSGVVFRRDDALPAEGYRLHVTEDTVTITSADDAGEIWAVQTLLQLLPAHIWGNGPMALADLAVPCVEIEDAPRFAWRGSHVDVARHFLPLDGLLKHLEVMAAHKLNVLHLHLTDDQGWRLPVPKYPKLTEVGARRPGTIPGHQPPPDANDFDISQHDGVPHGGAYTADELRHLVSRAAELGITVMPEIDMPGHMEAAIAAYPELGACDHVQHPRTCFGISTHVLRLSDDALAFCRDVLDTVMELFPDSPIHIGGDECPADEWFTDPVSQATMAEHGLTAGAEAQAWFEEQMCRYLLEAGRRVVVWDEVFDAGAPDGVTIMVWRPAEDRLARAAAQGLDVIAAPVTHTYLDYSQYDRGQPLAIGGPLTLETTARFHEHFALPAEHRHHLLGGQFQLWTEYVHDWARAEYHLWPRGSVIAQQLWAGEPSGVTSLSGMTHHLDRLTAMGLNWCRPPIQHEE